MACSLSPCLFAAVASRGRWKIARHLLAIESELLDLFDRAQHGGTRQMLIIQAPPRHGKSELISRYLPAWFVGTRPDKRVILTSYGDRLARKNSRKARQVMEESGLRFWGHKLSPYERSGNVWKLDGHEGGVVAAGIGGPITGEGADLLVVDDYLKSNEAAISETVRDSQWDWWHSTASTRLEPGGVVVIMATRWHEDDLIGRILKSASEGAIEQPRIVSMPAIAEDDDYLGRRPGEALWPERYPIEELERIRTEKVGDLYWWLAMYQQRPSQYGRTSWPEEYFSDIWAEGWPDEFDLSAMAIDPSKGKNAKRGDPSAVVFAGAGRGKIWVDAKLARIPPTQLVDSAIEMFCEHKPHIVGLEANQFQDLLAPEFDRQCQSRAIMPLPISLINNTVNKQLRIERLGPYLARHQVVIRDNPGGRWLYQQLKEFPLAAHDDGPDALEMAIRLMTGLLNSAGEVSGEMPVVAG